MTRNRTARKIARRTGLVAAVAVLALAVAPAAGMAKAPVKFGSMLNSKVQPSNSLPGLDGQRISYRGQMESAEEEGDYKVESFDVDMKIKKGEQLALRGSITSMIRCSSGGPNTLI